MKLSMTIVAVCGLATGAFAGGMTGSGLVVLDTSANGALSMTGNSEVDIPTNAVYVNSSSSTAVKTTGTARLKTPDLYVVGGTSFTGNSGCTGTVHKSVAAFQDPLSGTQFPSSTGMTDLGSKSVTGNSTVSISPGYYSHGISITGNSTVTFQPGVYVLKGDLKISSGSVSGQGVSFVMLDGSLSISGASSLTLSPPTTGAMAGIVIGQPASNTSGMSLTGGSEVNISGSIYVPGATLSLTGNSSMAGQGPQMGDLVDAKKVSLTGTAAIKIGQQSQPAVSLPTMALYD